MPDLTPIQKITEQVILFLPTLVGAIILFIVFWIISSVVGRIITGIGNRAKIDPVVRKLVADAARLTIIIMGAITALGTLGIDVTALVAGLGLTSLALGLALQDMIRNAISGMLILMYHPFKLGDTINVSGSEGRIVNIDLRYTTLEGDGKTILIPNQSVFNNVVVVNRPPDEKQIAR